MTTWQEDKEHFKNVSLDFFFYRDFVTVIGRNNTLGHLCGYVRLSIEHELNGVGCDDIEGLDVHGGLTYSGDDLTVDDSWYLGFDCAHAGDLVPEMAKRSGNNDFATYRDVEFVKNELMRLVNQIIAQEYSF